MKRAWKRGIANCLLVTLGVCVALVIVELGVRALGLYRFPGEDFVEADPHLGWRHIPNKDGYYRIENARVSVKINSKGLRDREYSYEKGNGVFRILVLGDSFAEGFQVPLEDTFCKVLEKELTAEGKRSEVINAGFGGVGTDYELLFFRREGYKYRPDLVLLAFFSNDVSDNFRSRRILDDRAGPVAYEKSGVVETLRKFLAKESRAYNYLGYVIPKELPFLARGLMKLGLLSSQPIDNAAGVEQLHYLVFEKKYGPEWQEAWDVTRALITKLKLEVESHGARLAVVGIPFREQVYDQVWNSRLATPGMRARDWDMSKPERILEEFLGGAGIPFLPLLAEFKAASGMANLYFSHDGHWNTSGHHLAGRTIAEWLADQDLAPSPK